MRSVMVVGALVATVLAGASPALAGTVVAGFNANTLPANDDGSTGLVNIGFSANFFGTTYTQTYVNNNGNITFNNPLSTFTPFNLTGSTGNPIIAPFFADVDTRGSGSGLVTYGTGTFGGLNAFGVNWLDVGYFGSHVDKLNSFQLLLVSRSDLAAGDFDIYFNYDKILWETGDASSGSGGLGGVSARVGYNSGAGTSFELAGSGVNGAFLNGGASQLITTTNYNNPGSLLFNVRNGQVVHPPVSGAVPEPATWAMMMVGLGLMAGAMRRQRATARVAYRFA